MLIGLQKYARTALRRRASSPKLQVFAPALTTALDARLPEVQLRDPVRRGRICESAVGAHLLAQAPNAPFEVGYGREDDAVVDFVVHGRGDPVAIEVKSRSAPRRPSGRSADSNPTGPEQPATPQLHRLEAR
jgi:predicted AAA+ superfamily ATPase